MENFKIEVLSGGLFTIEYMKGILPTKLAGRYTSAGKATKAIKEYLYVENKNKELLAEAEAQKAALLKEMEATKKAEAKVTKEKATKNGKAKQTKSKS